jgi:hypothetical protein
MFDREWMPPDFNAIHQQLCALYPGRVRQFLGVFNATLRQDLATLSNARLLVGPHGAGLAAMVFLPPTGQVLEIRDESHSEPYSCFEEMVKHLMRLWPPIAAYHFSELPMDTPS